jgi:cobalt/nickel transport system permease protein
MHIPDGFLSTGVAATSYGVSAVTGALAIRNAKKKFSDRLIPLAGVTAAFIFAAQMINFPIGFGTSGHFLGALLACVLLGPSMGFWIMALVLIVQALLFADGGITALGANVLNMGLIGGVVCYYIYTAVVKLMPKNKGSLFVITFIVAWFAVVLASAVCSLELAISGTIPFNLVFPSMVGFHAIIGVGEGLITASVLTYVLAARPDLVYAVSDDLKIEDMVKGVA